MSPAADQPMLRCSPAVRGLGVDPIGSAVGGCSFLVVERPLPWPRDIGDDDGLKPLHEALAGEPWRLQTVVRDRDCGDARVTAYVLPDGAFRRFEVRELVVLAGEVVDAAIALHENPSTGTPNDREEILICTHGRRDACCGSLGTALWKSLIEDPPRLPQGLRVSRTSHTGGHRFAPTALHLPAGTSWAWLDPDLALGIVTRSVPFTEVAAHYRGSLALPTPAEQVVDKAMLETHDWPWLDYERAIRTVDRDAEGATVEITFTTPAGERGRATGTTRTTGWSPIPDCGAPVTAAPKRQPIVELEDVRISTTR